ncbi:hypothetical protein KA013_00905 [Patescibacteria group bacterium]|jgi:hypothetical protein|nr:hypothetical protein [Patescibacteria group bacterium]
MKYVLSDHAWRYIDSDQDARCRLTDHRDAFAKIGIDVPVFPDRIEEYLSNPKKYSPTDSIVDELWSPPSSGYSSRIVFVGFEDYRLLNGDVIFVAHRA